MPILDRIGVRDAVLAAELAELALLGFVVPVPRHVTDHVAGWVDHRGRGAHPRLLKRVQGLLDSPVEFPFFGSRRAPVVIPQLVERNEFFFGADFRVFDP